MKKIFLASLIAISSLSCNNIGDSNFQIEPQNQSTSNVINKINSALSTRYISDEQIEQIGQLHNLGLEEAFADFNWNANNLQNELSNKFTNVSYVKDNNINFDNTVRTYNDNMIRIKENLVNPDNFVFFQNVLDFLNNDEDKNFEIINSFLVNSVNEMSENSTEVRDYETFLIFTTVIRYSSKFWLDSEIGGLNNYEKFKMQSGGISSKKGWRKCLTDVLAADGASAAGGFIVGAIAGAASGPIAPFTFIATIAAEAGLGSGYTYLTSGNC